jgi:uncharacterized coiled-coil protein SlyX
MLYALLQTTKSSLEDRIDRLESGTNARFESMESGTNARFESMYQLQRKMAARLVSMEQRLDEQAVTLGSLQKRVDTLHILVERTAGHVARLEQEYVMITESLRRLEKRFDALDAQRLNDRITDLEARVSNLESS